MFDLDILSRREAMLAALADQHLRKPELVERLGTSRSTVDRAIRELETEGLVQRESTGYTATLLGRFALEQYCECRSEIETLCASQRALEPLPADVELPVEMIVTAQREVATDPAPYRPTEQIHRSIEEADSFRIILPVLYDTRFLERCYEHAVTQEKPASLVVDETFFETVRKDFPSQLREKSARERFCLRIGDPPVYGLLLTTAAGKTTATTIIFEKSLGAVHAVLTTDDTAAVQWAEHRFERAIADSADVTEQVATEFTTDESGSAAGGN